MEGVKSNDGMMIRMMVEAFFKPGLSLIHKSKLLLLNCLICFAAILLCDGIDRTGNLEGTIVVDSGLDLGRLTIVPTAL
jgi:hypothetical protein